MFLYKFVDLVLPNDCLAYEIFLLLTGAVTWSIQSQTEPKWINQQTLGCRNYFGIKRSIKISCTSHRAFMMLSCYHTVMLPFPTKPSGCYHAIIQSCYHSPQCPHDVIMLSYFHATIPHHALMMLSCYHTVILPFPNEPSGCHQWTGIKTSSSGEENTLG